MKKTKIILSMIVLLIVLIQSIKAQTNVSGGIYSNTTWTAANSPYIAVDSIVVFPGVTLTIEPGVTVKFNDQIRIEVRGNLIANGNAIDSITFTSNSANPDSGKWNGIYLNYCTDSVKFNYCNFLYSTFAIYSFLNNQILEIHNSTFNHNIEGCDLDYGNIDSCYFSFNSYGIVLVQGYNVIKNCEFKNCGYGLYSGAFQASILQCKFISNRTGINAENYTSIFDCYIDSNSVAGIAIGGYSEYDTIMRCEIKKMQ